MDENTISKAMSESIELIEFCNIAMIGSIDNNDYPNIKAMLKIETEGLKIFWFSTNTSSNRVTQFKSNSKASVYFVRENPYKGLMLIGNIEILNDLESKKRLWRDGFESYYPKGIHDSDYTVFRFIAKSGNYYYNLNNVSFDL